MVRKANKEDLEFVVQCQMNMAMETEGLELDKEILQKGVQSILEDSNKGEYFIEFSEEGNRGMLLITKEWSDWRNAWVWWIQSVYVMENFREKKVYTNLYQYIKDLAIDNEEVRGIRLYVDKTNSKAQKVYSRLGMNGEHYATFEWMKSY
jgi:GNAT superfamily N-acetyltransferase